jgi:hypothetical protein
MRVGANMIPIGRKFLIAGGADYNFDNRREMFWFDIGTLLNSEYILDILFLDDRTWTRWHLDLPDCIAWAGYNYSWQLVLS